MSSVLNDLHLCVVSSTQSASGKRERDGSDVTEYPCALESTAVVRSERRLDWLQNSLPSRPRRRRYLSLSQTVYAYGDVLVI